MPIGVIKFYSERRGYGFIEYDEAPPDGGDVFLHYSQAKGLPRLSLTEGARVSFDLKEGHRGLEAVNVQALA
jgi:CspA family cold shock protein